MLFALRDYLDALPHLGRPTGTVLPFPIAVRDVPGTAHRDAIGPWPYVPAPAPAELAAALDELRRLGLVSLTLMLAPDTGPADASAYAELGVTLRPLKDHFVVDPARPAAVVGPRTRRNLAIAARNWEIVEELEPAGLAATAARLYAGLADRRVLSDVTRMPPSHFADLARLPGIAFVTARRGATIGAMVVAAREQGQGRTDLLHLLIDQEHLATCPGYAVLAHVAREWSRGGPVYLGGMPDGPDGPGVGRFKARWANRTSPLLLATAILQPETYATLSAGMEGGFFPAYRQPMTRGSAP